MRTYDRCAPCRGTNKFILRTKLDKNQERVGESAPKSELPNRRITAVAGVTTPDIVVKLEFGGLLDTTNRYLIDLEHPGPDLPGQVTGLVTPRWVLHSVSMTVSKAVSLYEIPGMAQSSK